MATAAGFLPQPSSTTVDLATLVNLSNVVGAAKVVGGNFKQAVVTVDYSAAQTRSMASRSRAWGRRPGARTDIVLDARNSAIGARAEIQIGAETVDIAAEGIVLASPHCDSCKQQTAALEAAYVIAKGAVLIDIAVRCNGEEVSRAG